MKETYIYIFIINVNFIIDTSNDKWYLIIYFLFMKLFLNIFLTKYRKQFYNKLTNPLFLLVNKIIKNNNKNK